MPDTPFTVRELDAFEYVDEGPRDAEVPPVVLLHGMLGDLSNWTTTIEALSNRGYRVLAPTIPVYDLPLGETSVPDLADFVRSFIERLELEQTVLTGNSLGGHIALLYALKYAEDVAALVLSGSSGIYEATLGTTTMRRQDREFIRERTEMTFYDPAHATEELVDEMLDIVNDRPRALRLIKIARSADEETVTEQLGTLPMPTLLIWGRDDVITPPDVAEEFRDRMPNAHLHFIDECGHAPMIEHPDQFNELTLQFLDELSERQNFPQS
ncbi:alpha/beta hydrolase [Longibacter salinarum]|uniref:Alpha/beta hydrolase n=1 Tax=Longibacter salinarum TaxID=1850348 RepID=A0A2A8CWP4_9BACT|nr:alpha/beta fold hydrolase [Longibacter salinarum]PEN13066.1 alpha/beta hydrolase [Longibacter salinarum]